MIKQLQASFSSRHNEKAKTFGCLNDNNKSKIEIILEAEKGTIEKPIISIEGLNYASYPRICNFPTWKTKT